MSALDDIFAFGMKHSDLLKQIENMALDEAMVVLKQIAPNHPLFIQIAQKVVDLLEEKSK